jgi:hypothetical protein
MPLKNFIKINGRMLVGGTIIAILVIMAIFAPVFPVRSCLRQRWPI